MISKQCIAAAVSVVCLTGACTSFDGTYRPDCMAHAGNRITLQDGRFVWEKFTDQVRVNDAGQVVDPFPDYPLQGRYRIEDDIVHFEPDTGQSLPDMHLQHEGQKTYLLTEKQLQSWPSTRPRCPLALESTP
jgi:hypothetical protein